MVVTRVLFITVSLNFYELFFMYEYLQFSPGLLNTHLYTSIADSLVPSFTHYSRFTPV
jgi:hypothetical protein